MCIKFLRNINTNNISNKTKAKINIKTANSKKALVFGASSGIGLGIAKVFFENGFEIAISARPGKKIEQARDQISSRVSIVTADFLKSGDSKAAVHEAIQKLNGLDVLVVNTGGPSTGSFESIGSEKWLEGFQSLWLSTVDAISAALPRMREQNFGRILLIASTSAREPIPNLTVSNGLRAGLFGLMKSLSSEVAIQGITVNTILPGFIDTERLSELGIQKSDIIKNIPAGRLGHVEEVGKLAAFLASNDAAYITGQAIAIDGGRLRGI